MRWKSASSIDSASSVIGLTFSKLLRKIFLILGQSLKISGKTLTRRNFTLLTNIHDLTTTSRNNAQHDAKIKVLGPSYN